MDGLALTRQVWTLRACQSCSRLRPGSLRQWPGHRPDAGRGPASRRLPWSARQHHAALGRTATSDRGWHDARLISAVAADPAGVNMDRVASTMQCNRRNRRQAACAGRCDGGDRGDLTGAAGLDMVVHARGRGRCRGAGGDLRRRTSVAAMLISVSAAAGAVLRRGVASTAQTFSCNRSVRRCSPALIGGAGGSLRTELLTAPCRGLPVHDPGARAACAQWRVGPHRGPCPPWRGPPDLRGPRHSWRSRRDCCSDWRSLASPCRSIRPAGQCPYGRTSSPPASRSLPTASSFPRRLHMLGWPVAVGMAGPCIPVGRAVRLGRRCRDRRLGRLPDRRDDPDAGRAPLAHAVCGHWLRLRGVDDPGRLPVQDGERTCCNLPTARIRHWS